ncbi:hypothetical protein Godav_000030 [Gossypium davidsonii]|uniref:Uncharacterized protein n=1 Tax=Gossypium davidsonii TaxID=34287 RepID=A0A7J8TI03_GOSDV|nr:hypothetical protein [Gossypium davidsonii]
MKKLCNLCNQMCIQYAWDWLLQWDLFFWSEEKLPNI